MTNEAEQFSPQAADFFAELGIAFLPEGQRMQAAQIKSDILVHPNLAWHQYHLLAETSDPFPKPVVAVYRDTADVEHFEAVNEFATLELCKLARREATPIDTQIVHVTNPHDIHDLRIMFAKKQATYPLNVITQSVRARFAAEWGNEVNIDHLLHVLTNKGATFSDSRTEAAREWLQQRLELWGEKADSLLQNLRRDAVADPEVIQQVVVGKEIPGMLTRVQFNEITKALPQHKVLQRKIAEMAIRRALHGWQVGILAERAANFVKDSPSEEDAIRQIVHMRVRAENPNVIHAVVKPTIKQIRELLPVATSVTRASRGSSTRSMRVAGSHPQHTEDSDDGLPLLPNNLNIRFQVPERVNPYLGVSDEALMAGFQAGNKEMFGELYNRYRGIIQRFLNSWVLDHETAEDLTNETFIRAYRSGSRTESAGVVNISGWLHQIARRLTIDRSRKKGSRPTAEFNPDYMTDPERVESLDDDRLFERTKLQEAVATLGDVDQEVLTLRFTMGLHADEMAELLGLEVGAVRARIHRAVVKLRKLMADDSDE